MRDIGIRQRRPSDAALPGSGAPGGLGQRPAKSREPCGWRGRSLHSGAAPDQRHRQSGLGALDRVRSEEHTSELQSCGHLVCRLLLAKKKTGVYFGYIAMAVGTSIMNVFVSVSCSAKSLI